MAATGPKPPKPEGEPATPGQPSGAADLIASDEFQQKLDRARERRAQALAASGGGSPKPVPEAPVLVLRAPQPPESQPAEPEPAASGQPDGTIPAAAPPPLAAPRRAASPRGRGRRRLGRGLAVGVAAITMMVALSCVGLVVLADRPVPSIGTALEPPRMARPFALDPAAPAAPAPLVVGTAPDLPAPPAAEGEEIAPPPDPPAAPAEGVAPVLGPPPAPPLAAFQQVPVQLLSGPSTGVAELAERLRKAGIEEVASRDVDLRPATTTVRFYREADRPLAAALAARLEAELQDLSSYRPAPSSPGVEVWLAGS